MEHACYERESTYSPEGAGTSTIIPSGRGSGGPDANSQTGIASSCRSLAARKRWAPGIHSPAKTVQPMIAFLGAFSFEWLLPKDADA